MTEIKKRTTLDSVAEDLFSTMPLIARGIRRKLLKTAFTGFNPDITPAHFEILKLLEEKESLHIAEISERLQIARPQMTHLIDRLAGLELVQRNTGTEDRRMIYVTLTGKGRKMIKEHEGLIRTATREMLASLAESDLETLSDSLRTLREIFSRLD